METLKAIQSRNSVPFLEEPAPTSSQMIDIYKGALRAPDHANLRPWKFIEVRDKGRNRLGDVFLRTAEMQGEDLSEEQKEKLKIAPLRSPMLIILAANIKEHPKVPKIEQIISLGAAAQNILLGIHEMGFAAVWRTGKMAFNSEITLQLGLKNNYEVIGYLYIGTSSGKEKRIPEHNIEDFVEFWN